MPEASVSSEYAESFQNSLAQREAKQWLISSDFLVDDAQRHRLLENPVNSSHCFASQADLCSNSTSLRKTGKNRYIMRCRKMQQIIL